MNYYLKSLNIIELDTVLNMLSNEAASDQAKQLCLNLLPSSDINEVNRRIEETNSACSLIVYKGSPSFSGVKDVRSSLERVKLGGCLNTRELLDIANVLRTSRLVKEYISDAKTPKTSIDYLFNGLKTNKYLEDLISTSIPNEDEISDSASNDLADIRRKMRIVSSNARDALQKIISSPSYSKALQENIITMRSDRFVVPVKAEHKGDIPGLVHDVSSTGATLFIEPMAVVKANNELRELASKEKIEIERILFELSSECSLHSDDIESNFSLLVKLDFIFAKAKLSYSYEGIPADYNKTKISLVKARHPLLKKDTVVPVDIELNENYDTLVITGPNTGGKTVLLKTIGLLSAMNQCGLHIPAKDQSCLPVFDNILADIGDEQSIEQSLSTFSSHMTNIVNIIDNCTSNSLVLFDELGAGTDPTEGAALAISIIESIRKKNATVAATTHYNELKIYALNTAGVQNASCEFDVESLKPTYRLLIGIPGKSNAFAISQKLGLNKSIIDEARKILSNDNIIFESTVEKLENTRLELEHKINELELNLREAEENNKIASKLKAELEVRLEKSEIKAKRQAEQIINEARVAAENAFNEIDEMKRKINEEDDVAKINEARNELRKKLNLAQNKFDDINKEYDNRISSRKIIVGDYVEIKNMGLKGEVIDINKDGNATVRCGSINITSPEINLFLLDSYAVKPKNSNKVNVKLNTNNIKTELDIRGMDTIEGVMTAESFIDSSVINKIATISIIHGKGTGTLRSAIHKMLKSNKLVKDYRLGNFGEGESGVTIVNLK